jgi:ATP-binding cassette, subfamily G (WHITE), eye pigment precursor transporter
MESMKSLAMNGRLVISVIHQPRSSIYEMFDRLLLLSCGRVMFLGKKATEIFDYFVPHNNFKRSLLITTG